MLVEEHLKKIKLKFKFRTWMMNKWIRYNRHLKLHCKCHYLRTRLLSWPKTYARGHVRSICHSRGLHNGLVVLPSAAILIKKSLPNRFTFKTLFLFSFKFHQVYNNSTAGGYELWWWQIYCIVLKEWQMRFIQESRG